MAKKATKKTTKKSTKKETKNKAKAPKKADKPTTKKATSKKSSKTTKPAQKPETKANVFLKRNGKDADGNAQYSAIKVYEQKPAGWKETKTTAGVPKGYKLISNGETVKSGKRRIGFLKNGK